MTDLVTRAISILGVNGDRWRALATGIDQELLLRPPAPGEWSALQCLGHATDTEAAVFAARVRALQAGNAVLAAYDPDREATPITAATDPAALAARHAAVRAETLAILGTVGERDLDRAGRHVELGTVTLRQLVNQWVAHDFMHLVQAERAVMQAFIPESGPWRSSFADHDVEASAADAPA
jgi:hypothetical protein